jgi:hypothetical protein
MSSRPGDEGVRVDGMRVQFDIPETEMGEGAKLLGMRGKRLIVTVEVIHTEQDNARRKIHI